jgi:hypothetical protein
MNAVRWAEGSITQLPVKTPVYGTLVGLINAKNADFGREVVSKVGERLQQALHDRSALDVKLLTRFLAELVNAHVLPAADLVALFDLLLASAAELDDSLQHSDLEHYAYVVLITIPFVAATLLRDLPDELDRLLRTLQRYVDAHKCPINPLTLVYPDPEVLHLLPDRVHALGARDSNGGWPFLSFFLSLSLSLVFGLFGRSRRRTTLRATCGSSWRSSRRTGGGAGPSCSPTSPSRTT